MDLFPNDVVQLIHGPLIRRTIHRCIPTDTAGPIEWGRTLSCKQDGHLVVNKIRECKSQNNVCNEGKTKRNEFGVRLDSPTVLKLPTTLARRTECICKHVNLNNSAVHSLLPHFLDICSQSNTDKRNGKPPSIQT